MGVHRQFEAAPGIVGICQRQDLADEKRAVFKVWARQVVALVEQREFESGVLPFHPAR